MFICKIEWPKLQKDLSNLFRTLKICKNVEKITEPGVSAAAINDAVTVGS